MRARREDPYAFGLATSVFTLLTILLAFAALAVAGQALSTSKDAKDIASIGGSGAGVTLTEFRIEPATVEVPVGGALTVRNNGKIPHNVSITGTDVRTEDLNAGKAASLDLSDLKPGRYEMFCSIAGHKGSGMVGEVVVGDGGASHEGTDHGVSSAANDAADKRMADRTKAFPQETEGLGGQPLAPVVQPDDTLQFDLTASVVDWEVEAGKTVQAWTYNGTVPGPTIKVQPGDRVRVVLTNELPESTTIHFHGLVTPNSMDGVPDITQPAVKPGESFAYEFVAQGPAVGMYHSHHHAEHQVPDGLAGAFLIGDQPVPAGTTVNQELAMVLNDAGTIGLAINGKSFPATAPVVAKQGEWVEIHYMNEGLQIHPMHLHGMPQLVIAKDGIALPQPYQADTIAVAPGERYTVLVHATELGTWAFHCHILNHAEGEQGMFGMVTALIVQ